MDTKLENDAEIVRKIKEARDALNQVLAEAFNAGLKVEIEVNTLSSGDRMHDRMIIAIDVYRFIS